MEFFHRCRFTENNISKSPVKRSSMKNKIKILSLTLTGCLLAGCTCYSTHVPGRRIDHPANPGGIDIFFCNLDYILFPPPPPPPVVVAPPPPVIVTQPAPVVVAPPPPRPVVVTPPPKPPRPVVVAPPPKPHHAKPVPPPRKPITPPGAVNPRKPAPAVSAPPRSAKGSAVKPSQAPAVPGDKMAKPIEKKR